MQLSTDDVDALIAELEGMQVISQEISERRKKIRQQLNAGRHEGTYRDLRMSAPLNRSSLDRVRLLRYVDPQIIERCTKYSTYDGNVMVVPKLKRKLK